MAYWDYNDILTRMLIAAQNAQPDCDTREGSLIYTACAPMAAELAQAYIAATMLLENTFADTASRDYLVRRALERNIVPYSSVPAQYTASYNYKNAATIPPEAKFISDDGLVFSVTAVDEVSKLCNLLCDTTGAVGNGKLGNLVPVNSDPNFVSMVFVNTTVIGEDEESTEHLRRRYFQELQSPAFGGNVTDYVNFTNELDGVGAVKVESQWNGPGTVKVIITDAALQPPNNDLVSRVQSAIDPEVNQGVGVGIAPIGHTVTVVGANSTVINISAYFVYKPGYSYNMLTDNLNSAFRAHIDELNMSWEIGDNIVVRTAGLISDFLAVQGVVDVLNLKINGYNSNLTLSNSRVAAYGTLIDTGV